ncbi:hypothetical protein EB796_017658 [Bugula neritina]|uniref:Borealin N-terminal domain-containing protein n=1 Tax=Bugula neritina TaxID=10212 RepID=A0A7J7JCW2_BUGNE|nr:hypothetical protein EB796_017658 [Bugula neritina]
MKQKIKMPKRKAPKKKVRHVYVPEGDEGKHLSAADKAAKLESFVQQFDMEVKNKLKALEKECEDQCRIIESTYREQILSLTSAEANMSILEYRKSILGMVSSSRKRESEVGLPNVSAIFNDIGNLKAGNSKQPEKKRTRVKGFATPAVGLTNEPLWTATPEQTPLFDKRLLNVKK